MSAERALRSAAAILVLAVSLLAASRMAGTALPADVASFRSFFWSERALDVLVQAGLTLVGALGIVALLPTRKEYEE